MGSCAGLLGTGLQHVQSLTSGGGVDDCGLSLEVGWGPDSVLSHDSVVQVARDAPRGGVELAGSCSLGGGNDGAVGQRDPEPDFCDSDEAVGDREATVFDLDGREDPSAIRCETLLPRSSRRLASVDATPILIKAVVRKARREAGLGSGGGSGATPSIKKILGKSRLCGVRLDDGEASSFREFVGSKS